MLWRSQTLFTEILCVMGSTAENNILLVYTANGIHSRHCYVKKVPLLMFVNVIVSPAQHLLLRMQKAQR